MSTENPSVINLANGLSALRLVLAPILLILAYLGASQAFLYCLIISLVTDILDGKVARWLNQTSPLGGLIDSWADFATYMTVPFCAYWLKPDFIQNEAIFFILAVASYSLPVLIGFLNRPCERSLGYFRAELSEQNLQNNTKK